MGKKDINDKFYTKEYISIECIKLLNLNAYDYVIEPSAGGGSFSNNIQHDNLIAIDLYPESEDIIKEDWFEFNRNIKGQLLIVGNPPFGERNNLSKKFIKKAISLNPKTIAFILPDVFNKYTLQSIFPKEYRLKEVKKLPKNSFILNEIEYDIPCSFFIWDISEGEDLRFDVSKYITNDFEFISKPNTNNNCFFILGAAPNTTKEIKDVSCNNRGYYIKPKIKTKEYLLKKFKEIKFIGYSSVNGKVKWLTKPEIIKNYIGE